MLDALGFYDADIFHKKFNETDLFHIFASSTQVPTFNASVQAVVYKSLTLLIPF